MSDLTTTEEMALREDLAALCDEAERAGLWLNCSYQDLWFSPAELRAEHTRGKFLWGRVNWHLRDPKEHLEPLDQKNQNAASERQRFSNRAGL